MSALDPIRNIPFEDQSIGLHQWLGIRKDAALKIDPETAEVHWSYGLTMDPYGVENNLPRQKTSQFSGLGFSRILFPPSYLHPRKHCQALAAT